MHCFQCEGKKKTGKNKNRRIRLHKNKDYKKIRGWMQEEDLEQQSPCWVIFAVRTKKKKGCRDCSVAAYVQRVIKVKDLQFSAAPPAASHPFRNYGE